MSVANIFNIPGDISQLAFWSRTHTAWHRSANEQILRAFNVILPEFVLDPLDPDEGGVWLRNHQTMHDNLDALLGVPSYNLMDVDWTDEAQRLGWFQDHAQQTRQEADALGVQA